MRARGVDIHAVVYIASGNPASRLQGTITELCSLRKASETVPRYRLYAPSTLSPKLATLPILLGCDLVSRSQTFLHRALIDRARRHCEERSGYASDHT